LSATVARPRSSKSSTTEDLGLLIFKNRRQLWNEASRALEAIGESVLTYSLLNHLAMFGARSQGEIAEGTGQHPAGVCRVLVELEEQALVRRRRDPGDRRRVVVDLTRAGRAKIDAQKPVVSAAIERVLAPLDAEERKTLARLLAKLVQKGS
jgi:DNA-binding MarR family transcriptional regulator